MNTFLNDDEISQYPFVKTEFIPIGIKFKYYI